MLVIIIILISVVLGFMFVSSKSSMSSKGQDVTSIPKLIEFVNKHYTVELKEVPEVDIEDIPQIRAEVVKILNTLSLKVSKNNFKSSVEVIRHARDIIQKNIESHRQFIDNIYNLDQESFDELSFKFNLTSSILEYLKKYNETKQIGIEQYNSSVQSLNDYVVQNMFTDGNIVDSKVVKSIIDTNVSLAAKLNALCKNVLSKSKQLFTSNDDIFKSKVINFFNNISNTISPDLDEVDKENLKLKKVNETTFTKDIFENINVIERLEICTKTEEEMKLKGLKNTFAERDTLQKELDTLNATSNSIDTSQSEGNEDKNKLQQENLAKKQAIDEKIATITQKIETINTELSNVYEGYQKYINESFEKFKDDIEENVTFNQESKDVNLLSYDEFKKISKNKDDISILTEKIDTIKKKQKMDIDRLEQLLQQSKNRDRNNLSNTGGSMNDNMWTYYEIPKLENLIEDLKMRLKQDPANEYIKGELNQMEFHLDKLKKNTADYFKKMFEELPSSNSHEKINSVFSELTKIVGNKYKNESESEIKIDVDTYKNIISIAGIYFDLYFYLKEKDLQNINQNTIENVIHKHGTDDDKLTLSFNKILHSLSIVNINLKNNSNDSDEKNQHITYLERLSTNIRNILNKLLLNDDNEKIFNKMKNHNDKIIPDIIDHLKEEKLSIKKYGDLKTILDKLGVTVGENGETGETGKNGANVDKDIDVDNFVENYNELQNLIKDEMNFQSDFNKRATEIMKEFDINENELTNSTHYHHYTQMVNSITTLSGKLTNFNEVLIRNYIQMIPVSASVNPEVLINMIKKLPVYLYSQLLNDINKCIGNKFTQCVGNIFFNDLRNVFYYNNQTSKSKPLPISTIIFKLKLNEIVKKNKNNENNESNVLFQVALNSLINKWTKGKSVEVQHIKHLQTIQTAYYKIDPEIQNLAQKDVKNVLTKSRIMTSIQSRFLNNLTVNYNLFDTIVHDMENLKLYQSIRDVTKTLNKSAFTLDESLHAHNTELDNNLNDSLKMINASLEKINKNLQESMINELEKTHQQTFYTFDDDIKTKAKQDVKDVLIIQNKFQSNVRNRFLKKLAANNNNYNLFDTIVHDMENLKLYQSIRNVTKTLNKSTETLDKSKKDSDKSLLARNTELDNNLNNSLKMINVSLEQINKILQVSMINELEKTHQQTFSHFDDDIKKMAKNNVGHVLNMSKFTNIRIRFLKKLAANNNNYNLFDTIVDGMENLKLYQSIRDVTKRLNDVTKKTGNSQTGGTIDIKVDYTMNDTTRMRLNNLIVYNIMKFIRYKYYTNNSKTLDTIDAIVFKDYFITLIFSIFLYTLKVEKLAFGIMVDQVFSMGAYYKYNDDKYLLLPYYIAFV